MEKTLRNFSQLALCLAFVLAGPTFAGADEGNEQDTMIGIKKVSIARVIEKRKPKQVGTTVAADGKRVYVHMAFRALEDSRIKVNVKRGTKVIYKAALRVGKSPSWKTWVHLKASKSMVGSYSVDIIDAKSGIRLTTKTFTIELPASNATAKADYEDIVGC